MCGKVWWGLSSVFRAWRCCGGLGEVVMAKEAKWGSVQGRTDTARVERRCSRIVVVEETVAGAGRRPRWARGVGRRAGERPPGAGYGPGIECPGCL